MNAITEHDSHSATKVTLFILEAMLVGLLRDTSLLMPTVFLLQGPFDRKNFEVLSNLRAM